jgi:hypothetical protein
MLYEDVAQQAIFFKESGKFKFPIIGESNSLKEKTSEEKVCIAHRKNPGKRLMGFCFDF